MPLYTFGGPAEDEAVEFEKRDLLESLTAAEPLHFGGGGVFPACLVLSLDELRAGDLPLSELGLKKPRLFSELFNNLRVP